MPTEETQKLLDRLSELTQAAAASEATVNPRLDEAIDALYQMAGRPRSKEGSAFEDVVWHALSAIPGAVVSRSPRAAASSYQPDFLVTVGGHTFLVEAKDPSANLPGVAHQLADAVDAYGADEAVLVLPEGVKIQLDDEQLGDDRLQLLDLSGLRTFFTH